MPRIRLPALLTIVLVECDGCHRQAVPNEAAVPSVSATASAFVDAGPAPFSCTAVDPVTIDKTTMKNNITDVVDVTAAAVGDQAIVAFAVNGDHGCDHDGCGIFHEVHSFSIDAQTSTPPRDLPTSAVGISPTEDAVAYASGSDLFVLTQGHAGAVPMKERPTDDDFDTMYAVKDRTVAHKWNESFSGTYAAASNGSIAYIVGAGRLGFHPALPPQHAAVAVFRLDGASRAKAIVVESSPEVRFDAPAIAVRGDHVAIAYRAHDDEHAPRQIFVAWIDPGTAKPLAKPVAIAKGDVGAPALYIDDGGAHVVWAQRTSGPYALVRADLLASDPKPTAPSPLTTPTPSALAPSIAALGDRVLLAWMDGDARASGRIFAGIGSTLDAAASTAVERSDRSVKNARDPEWATAGDHALLVWVEHDGPRRARAMWCR